MKEWTRELYVGWQGKRLLLRGPFGDILLTPKLALKLAYRIIKRFHERQV